MGCAWSVTYVPGDAHPRDELSRGIQAVLGGVIAQMSTWEPDSVISRFNRARPGAWIALPAEFSRVLHCALRVAEITGGALDPAAGRLVDLWGFGPERRYHQPGFSLPDAAALLQARSHGGWGHLEFDPHAMRLYQPGGLRLDLSAIAKGFAVDAVSEYLSAHDTAHHLVEIGGELRGSGMKPDGQPWWVDVEPGSDSRTTQTRIALHDLSVATSGDYQQSFQVAGRHYSHTIDPRTGEPIDNGVTSVTVIHPACMEADAWSTALMVLGAGQGLPIAEKLGICAQISARTPGGVAEFRTSQFQSLIVEDR